MMTDETKVTYFGTNCLLFSKAGSTLMIDPHFTRPGFGKLLGRVAPDPKRIAESLAKTRVRSLDGVLLTHTHYDHTLDAVEVSKQTNAILYGSYSAKMLAQGEALDPGKMVEVSTGELNQIGEYQVRFLPSRHIRFPGPFRWFMSDDEAIRRPLEPPAWFWQYRSGQVYAIMVDRTLVFGSANFVTGAYSGLDVETVILSIGGLDMKPKVYLENLYAEVVLATGARQVLVSHWDNFFQPIRKGLKPLGGSQRILNRLRQFGLDHGQEIRLLKYGAPIIF